MKNSIADFHNIHKGQTCVIASVGPNLELTPPEWFDYPIIGVNTIYKRPNWKPTYYIGVDVELLKRDGAGILATYPDVPKFFPSDAEWGALQDENTYRFKHNTGIELFPFGPPRDKAALVSRGITYRRILDAAFQLAYYMGFSTILVIGVQHKPNTRKDHFWGVAEYEPQTDFEWEEIGYRDCARAMSDVRILNISADTYVPSNVLPRGDWKEWANAKQPVR